MAVSKARREANNRWDAENMRVLGCKVRKEKADAFKAACAANGTTVNAVLQKAIDAYMREHPAGAYRAEDAQC